ncbi:Structural maintenance of chromosomes protein 6, partial [Cladochytrium tenue]
VGQVQVTIRNRGPDAFKPGVYGDKIVVERRIVKDGSASYKIKAADGALVSTKKEELTAILDHMSIAIDNPMSILTQDTSRMFLANSTPKDKYNFFMKGTLLSQLIKELDQLSLSVDKVETILNSKTEEIERSENLENKIVTAKKMLAWALTEEAEKDKAAVRERKQAIEEKLAQTLTHVNEYDLLREKLALEIKSWENERGAVNQLSNPIKARRVAQREEVDAVNQKIRAHQGQVREIESSLRTAKELSEQYRVKIADEARKLQSTARINREEKLREIEALKTRRAELLASIRTTTSERANLEESLQQSRAQLQQLREEEARCASGVAGEEAAIQNLETSRTNRLSAFGRRMPDLVRAIEDCSRRRGWSGSQPRGPIGIFLTVRQREFTRVIENILGGVLNSFVVDNHADRRTLEGIMASVQCHSPIYTQDGRMFDFRDGEPDPSFVTIHRAIEVSDPVILRQLVLNSKIEKTVLVHTRQEGDEIAERGFGGRNIASVYTKDCLRMGGGRGGLITTVMNGDRGGPSRLFDNIDEAVMERRQRIRQLQQEIQALQERFGHQQSALDQLEAQRRSCQEENRTLGAEKTRLESTIRRLEDELEEADEEVEGIEIQLQNAMEQLVEFRKERDKLAQAVEELEQELRTVAAKHQDVGKRLLKTQGELLQVEAQAKVYKDRHQKYLDQVATLDKDLAEAERNVAELRATADEVCGGERLKVTKKSTGLQKEIQDMEITLREQRHQVGSKEDVLAHLREAESNYHQAKAEVRANTRLVAGLREALLRRTDMWRVFRRAISQRARNTFSVMMMKRGYRGELILNHMRETLDLRVDVHNTGTGTEPGAGAGADDDGGSQPVRQRRAGGGAGGSVDKDPRTLSGGEKSYSTVCLLLSLWESMGNPFRALDEFDVFMDAVNRKVSMSLMISHARRADKKCQYIFITPQDM